MTISKDEDVRLFPRARKHKILNLHQSSIDTKNYLAKEKCP